MTDSVHPVTLTTPRLRLREFRESDVDGLYALVGDDRVTSWLSFDSRSHQQAGEQLDGIIERASHAPRSEYDLATVGPEDDAQVIGRCRLGLGGADSGKLGFAINADYWGAGFATEAAGALIEFGFTTLGLHRITAAIGPDNDASIAVAAKLGMTFEGCLREHVFTNDARRDSLLYSILVQEWTP